MKKKKKSSPPNSFKGKKKNPTYHVTINKITQIVL